MRHASTCTESLRATIRGAAKLTVEEGARVSRFARWKPFSRSAVASPVDFEGEWVPEVPDAPEIAPVEESPGNPPLQPRMQCPGSWATVTDPAGNPAVGRGGVKLKKMVA
jgi:hypothetical protein